VPRLRLGFGGQASSGQALREITQGKQKGTIRRGGCPYEEFDGAEIKTGRGGRTHGSAPTRDGFGGCRAEARRYKSGARTQMIGLPGKLINYQKDPPLQNRKDGPPSMTASALSRDTTSVRMTRVFSSSYFEESFSFS